MLLSLFISNYALIQELEMIPSPNLNMITGETGAGKSIMLGAVGLLLGKRADTKALLDNSKKCIVEGRFFIKNYGLEAFFEEEDLDYEHECIIRREISPSGKSRAFINDSPVRLESLKTLGDNLMDVHSQHDNLQLAEGNYQLGLIDAFAGTKVELSDYQEAFKKFESTKKDLELLQVKAQELKKVADFNKFQLEELSAIQLVGKEQESLEEEQEILENAEELQARLEEVLNTLQDDSFGALRMVGLVNQTLGQISKLSQKFLGLSERAKTLWIELKDIAEELEADSQAIEVNYEKLELIRERLGNIYRLQQKHGVDTVEKLLEIEKSLAEKVFQTESLDDDLEALKIKLQEIEKYLSDKGLKLTEKRKAIFKEFSESIEHLLFHLGMENAKIMIKWEAKNPQLNGIDKIDLFFSSNKGIAPQPLKQVASGGEFSRLIFAIKYLMADKMSLPTLIFDEIDTGVSGEVALQMVRMMQEIGQKHQVICISHLPQVAAKGDKHYFVYKDNNAIMANSKIKVLEGEERILEIAKMIAGNQPSENAFKSAKELLQS